MITCDTAIITLVCKHCGNLVQQEVGWLEERSVARCTRCDSPVKFKGFWLWTGVKGIQISLEYMLRSTLKVFSR